MNYSEIRTTLKTGDIVAWSEGGSWLSLRGFQLNLIKLVTRSKFNHVGIVYTLAGRVFVVEAVVPLVRIFPLSKLRPFYLLPTRFDFTVAQEETMLERVGLPYSKWDAIRSVFTNRTDDLATWECAKLVTQTFKDFDKQFDELNDTPADVVHYLKMKYNIDPIEII